MENYTKNHLANDLSYSLEIPAVKAKVIVEEVLEALTEALAAGRSVEFRGFGIMHVVERKAKVGRNPSNLAAGTFNIPARKAVKFKLGKVLGHKLNP